MAPSDWTPDAEHANENHKGLKLSQCVSIMWLRNNNQLLSWRLWPDLHSSEGCGTSFQKKTINPWFSLKGELTVESKCDIQCRYIGRKITTGDVHVVVLTTQELPQNRLVKVFG